MRLYNKEHFYNSSYLSIVLQDCITTERLSYFEYLYKEIKKFYSHNVQNLINFTEIKKPNLLNNIKKFFYNYNIC